MTVNTGIMFGNICISGKKTQEEKIFDRAVSIIKLIFEGKIC